MEYANAVNVDQLSLGGWDQDQGNEFEGRHSIVAGGYTQLPRALWKYPTPLDVRLRKKAVRIMHRGEADTWNLPTAVECEDGEVVEADYIVNTLPLGVLKEGQTIFEPALPDWKRGAVQRLGFGLLNKVSIGLLLYIYSMTHCSAGCYGFRRNILGKRQGYVWIFE